MDTPTFNMTLELHDGTLRPHGFHLGTHKPLALTFVFNALRNMGARTVALYLGTELDAIYDWRDLPENAELDEELFDDREEGVF